MFSKTVLVTGRLVWWAEAVIVAEVEYLVSKTADLREVMASRVARLHQLLQQSIVLQFQALVLQSEAFHLVSGLEHLFVRCSELGLQSDQLGR